MKVVSWSLDEESDSKGSEMRPRSRFLLPMAFLRAMLILSGRVETVYWYRRPEKSQSLLVSSLKQCWTRTKNPGPKDDALGLHIPGFLCYTPYTCDDWFSVSFLGRISVFGDPIESRKGQRSQCAGEDYGEEVMLVMAVKQDSSMKPVRTRLHVNCLKSQGIATPPDIGDEGRSKSVNGET